MDFLVSQCVYLIPDVYTYTATSVSVTKLETDKTINRARAMQIISLLASIFNTVNYFSNFLDGNYVVRSTCPLNHKHAYIVYIQIARFYSTRRINISHRTTTRIPVAQLARKNTFSSPAIYTRVYIGTHSRDDKLIAAVVVADDEVCRKMRERER